MILSSKTFRDTPNLSDPPEGAKLVEVEVNKLHRIQSFFLSGHPCLVPQAMHQRQRLMHVPLCMHLRSRLFP